MTPRILIPLPQNDFDPSEVAIPWQALKQAGFDVEFATSTGERAFADPIMLTGQGLDFWGFVPGLKRLKLIGLLLRANKSARNAYAKLEQDPQFLAPQRFDQLQAKHYQGLLLGGGHAPGMKPYLENKAIQAFVTDCFEQEMSIAAICHGVVLAARSLSSKTQHSVLFGRKSTALPWSMERMAWKLCKYLCRFWDSGYYRTYLEEDLEPCGHRSVEMEVRRALACETDFIEVNADTPHRFLKTCGVFRDTPQDARPAFVMRDNNYLSARWPGDVHTFAKLFVELLNERPIE